MDPVQNYNNQVAQSQLALVQSYLNGDAPVGKPAACIPTVPTVIDEQGFDTGKPAVPTADVMFKYIEVTFHVEGGSPVTLLCIKTPWEVSGGPGAKYNALEKV